MSAKKHMPTENILLKKDYHAKKLLTMRKQRSTKLGRLVFQHYYNNCVRHTDNVAFDLHFVFFLYY